MLYLIEQCLNGIQLGMLLFLLAAGLTLIFGIMDLVNLAHGSLYMLGAYFAATFAAVTGSFVLGAILALLATLVVGMALEVIAIRRLYGRDHLDHVLGTFGLLLVLQRGGAFDLGRRRAHAAAAEPDAHRGAGAAGRVLSALSGRHHSSRRLPSRSCSMCW